MTFPTRAQLDAWHDEAMENGSKTAINRLHDAAARMLAERPEEKIISPTPAELEWLIERHEMAAGNAAISDDFNGERHHENRANEIRRVRYPNSPVSPQKPTEWCRAGEFGCECGRSEYEDCPLPHPGAANMGKVR